MNDQSFSSSRPSAGAAEDEPKRPSLLNEQILKSVDATFGDGRRLAAASDGTRLAFALFKDSAAIYPDQSNSAMSLLLAGWFDLVNRNDLQNFLDGADRSQRPNDQLLADWLASPASWQGVIDWSGSGLDRGAEVELNRYGGVFKDAIKRYLREFDSLSSPQTWRVQLLRLLALARLGEQNQDADRELISDSLTRGLRRIGSLRTSDLDGFLRFVDGMHGLLWFDRVHWTPDRQLSLAAFAETMGEFSRRQTLEMAVAYHERAIVKLCEREVSNGDQALVWRRARVACNNVSNHLSSLGNFDTGVSPNLSPKRRVLAKLLNRLQIISVIGNAHQVLDGRANEEVRSVVGAADSEAVWRAFGFDPGSLCGGVALSHGSQTLLAAVGSMVRVMMNVISGWALLDEAFFEPRMQGAWPKHGYLDETVALMISMISAVLRSQEALRADNEHDTPVSALFNAGLAITRVRRTVASSLQPPYRLASSICNTIGLHYAIQHGRTLRSSVSDLHGGSCMVNLIGAISEGISLAHVERLQRPMAGVVRIVAEWLHDNESGLDLADRERIASSLSDMGRLWPLNEMLQSALSMSDFDPLRALRSLVEELGICLGASAADGQSLRADGLTNAFPQVAAAFCSGALRRLLLPPEGAAGAANAATGWTYGGLVDAITVLLSELLKAAHQPRQLLLEELLFDARPDEQLSDKVEVGQAMTTIRRRLTDTEQFADAEHWVQLFARLAAFREECPQELQQGYAGFLDTPRLIAWINGVTLT